VSWAVEQGGVLIRVTERREHAVYVAERWKGEFGSEATIREVEQCPSCIGKGCADCAPPDEAFLRGFLREPMQ
jgi:hypothetical protein